MFMKWTLSIAKGIDGKYSATLTMGGKEVEGLPENVDYDTLKDAIEKEAGIRLLNHNDMIFEGYKRKYYAFLDSTQTRRDCRVTLEERLNGYKPCFD